VLWVDDGGVEAELSEPCLKVGLLSPYLLVCVCVCFVCSIERTGQRSTRITLPANLSLTRSRACSDIAVLFLSYNRQHQVQTEMPSPFLFGDLTLV